MTTTVSNMIIFRTGSSIAAAAKGGPSFKPYIMHTGRNKTFSIHQKQNYAKNHHHNQQQRFLLQHQNQHQQQKRWMCRKSGGGVSIKNISRVRNRKDIPSTNATTTAAGGGGRGVNRYAPGNTAGVTTRQQQRRRKATLARHTKSQQPHQTSSSCPIRNLRKGVLRYEKITSKLIRFHRDQLNKWLNVPRMLPVPRWINPRHTTYRISEIFGHGSFVLVAISYAVDDHLNLRILAILGGASMLVFTFFHPHGRILWLPFQWNCIFVALNSWRVAKVYYDQYKSKRVLSPSLLKIYDDHFYIMSQTDFARVIQLGHIEHYRKDEPIVTQDEENRYVRLVVKGDCEVSRDGQTTYWLHEGQFMSEMGLHAGLTLRGSVKSCCTVSAASDEVEVIRWDRTELVHLLELQKSIERPMKGVMSWDIVSKLKSQRVLLASGSIADPVNWTKKRREQALARYESILRNILLHPQYEQDSMRDQLRKYRDIHKISQGDHIAALERIGWTVEEFQTGYKDGQLDHDLMELKDFGWRWYLRSWWKAL